MSRSSWLNGLRPKDIAPKIFEISKKKACLVCKALDNNFWVRQIDISQGLTLAHIQEFAVLWELVTEVALNPDRKDAISWKFTSSGEYSAATAYKARFAGQVLSPTSTTIWKTWALPKCKFFAWLAIQNRVWTANRLAKRGWDNCGLCPLCKREQESVGHLFYKCRYTLRLWEMLKVWLQLDTMDITTWTGE